MATKKKQPRAKQKNNKDRWLQIRIDDELHTRLEAEAERRSTEWKIPVGVSTLARQLILTGLAETKRGK